ncbi:MAG: ABC transporter ATP-binding protein [Myxococcota bacterium]
MRGESRAEAGAGSAAGSNAATEVVRVRDVVKDVRPGFGLRSVRILHGISLDVRQGEIFGFVGPNGAGKTTTLKVLMGLIRATSGSAQVLGHDVSENAFRRHVGFLPENPYFYHHLTGREILRFYARVAGLSGSGLEQRVERLLGWVHLEHAADQRLRGYSKGMLQRVGIAQALVHDPSVVFLDEPMSGLDPIGRAEIRELILRLRTEGKTVFMNTHILSDVEMVCDRVAIIVKGRIRYQGHLEELLDGRQRNVDVVVAGLSPDTGEKLAQETRGRVRGHGERIEVRIAEKEVEDLLRRVLDDGGRIVSVTPHRASLETAFLAAVEDGGRSEAVEAGEEA